MYFFEIAVLSCTKVTTKGPKAERLLGERGGTMVPGECLAESNGMDYNT